MDETQLSELASARAVQVTNRDGSSPFVLICDHASNHLPKEFGTLGLPQSELDRHIAWDPGAEPVSRMMAEALDAVFVESGISRLVIDCNRPLSARDLIPAISETTAIPGNATIDAASRERRIALAWTPFHDAIDQLVSDRLAKGRETWLVSIHSFTPVYRGVSRPWHIGIIHDDDRRLASPLIAALKQDQSLVVGVNEPYSPADRVYFTLERHARALGLPCAMIEIRNDEIATEAGQQDWAKRLAGVFAELKPLGASRSGTATNTPANPAAARG